MHTIKALREQFKAVGKFHTPPELALFLRSLIPGEPAEVYDPTCGAGALLSVFPETTRKYGQDIDQAALQDAALIPNFTGELGDVLETPAWRGKKFPAIVANPPFSIAWRPHDDERWNTAPTLPTKSRADFVFLLHILAMLDGTAAVLQFPGICYRGNREQKLRGYITELGVLKQVIQIPGDTFTDTTISTVCLVLETGWDGDITFTDKETGISETVPRARVKAEDYNWSVTTYVQPPEEEKPPFDAWATEQAARNAAAQRLARELDFSKFVAELEGWPFMPFVDQLATVVHRYRVPDKHRVKVPAPTPLLDL